MPCSLARHGASEQCLKDPTDVPENVTVDIGQQRGIDHLSVLNRYGIGATRLDHIAEIKACYGYRDFTARAESFGLVRWLDNRCCFGHARPRVLVDLATARLVESNNPVAWCDGAGAADCPCARPGSKHTFGLRYMS